MASTSKILTSLHGKLIGLDRYARLIIKGRLAQSLNDAGTLFGRQSAPGTLNATGTLTIALMLGGVITSSTAAAVTATLDTGTVTDAGLTGAEALAVDDTIEWCAINTGGANAFTVTASSGHTIVGAGAVAASTSGRFLTRKTAANTYVTYRL